jgi:phage terminase small subunit
LLENRRKEKEEKMGVHRAPTKLLKLRGTYNTTIHKDRQDDQFPTLQSDITLPAPASLSERSTKTWELITSRLLVANALSEIDLPLLEQGLLLQDELDTIRSEIEHIRKKKKKTQQDYQRWNKLNSQLARTLTIYISILSRFGCSPSDRAKILSTATLVQERKDKKEKEENPILAILEDSEDE